MIENDVMRLRLPNGIARIYLAAYFPTSAERTRKLFKKLIILDPQWPEITKDLQRWIRDQIPPDSEGLLRAYANGYVNATDKYREITKSIQDNDRMIESYRGVISKTKDRMMKKAYRERMNERRRISKEMKETQRAIRDRRDQQLKLYRSLQRRIEMYNADIKELELQLQKRGVSHAEV